MSAAPRDGGFAALGARVRADLDQRKGTKIATPPRGSALLRARARPRSARIAAAACAVLAVATLVLLFVRAREPRALSASIGGEPVVAGAWVSASERAVPLTFSDGTRFDLAPGAHARVNELGPRGAEVTLERGGVHARVVHKEGARWRAFAGPFEVRVTGTEFDVQWDPDAATFRIKLVEGSVVVSGCTLGEGRRVAAGEELHVQCTRTPAPPPPPPSAGPAIANGPRPSGEPAPPVRPATPPRRDPAPPAAAAEDWRALLGERRWDEAVRAADAQGLAEVCASARGDELDALSDAARFARRIDVARTVLECTRRRFPGSERAATAAFELGRIAFDVARDYPRARAWFETYLREQPNGRLAREALGRAMEAADKANDVARAHELARRYLAAYPAGPHAPAAREILGGDP